MRTDDAEAVHHTHGEDAAPPYPEAVREAAADRDLKRQCWERLGIRVMWAVNLFGLIMLLVVFMKLDGLF